MTQQKLPWRDYLTDDERAEIEGAEELRTLWLRANASRAGIVNRAIHRAKYAAAKERVNDGGTGST